MLATHFLISLKPLKFYFSHWPQCIFNVRICWYCHICRNRLMFLQGVWATMLKQKCVPVGCILSSRGGSDGVFIGEGGGCLPGGCPVGCLPRRETTPLYAGIHTSLPIACWNTHQLWTEWLTRRCKNFTFPLCLRAVRTSYPIAHQRKMWEKNKQNFNLCRCITKSVSTIENSRSEI